MATHFFLESIQDLVWASGVGEEEAYIELETEMVCLVLSNLGIIGPRNI
jgi:hypothetical protein